MKICIAQCPSAQGNVEKSISNHIKLIHCAIEKQAEHIVFPELSISGYPLEDLVLKDGFLYEIKNKVEDFMKIYQNTLSKGLKKISL